MYAQERATYPFPDAHPYKIMSHDEMHGSRSKIWGLVHNEGCDAGQQNHKKKFYPSFCHSSQRTLSDSCGHIKLAPGNRVAAAATPVGRTVRSLCSPVGMLTVAGLMLLVVCLTRRS